MFVLSRCTHFQAPRVAPINNKTFCNPNSLFCPCSNMQLVRLPLPQRSVASLPPCCLVSPSSLARQQQQHGATAPAAAQNSPGGERSVAAAVTRSSGAAFTHTTQKQALCCQTVYERGRIRQRCRMRRCFGLGSVAQGRRRSQVCLSSPAQILSCVSCRPAAASPLEPLISCRAMYAPQGGRLGCFDRHALMQSRCYMPTCCCVSPVRSSPQLLSQANCFE
jgi:hypothetical protein